MTEEKRFEVKILGEVVFTATGWDEFSDFTPQYYNPELTEFGKFLFGNQWRKEFDTIVFEADDGTFTAFNENGSKFPLQFDLKKFCK